MDEEIVFEDVPRGTWSHCRNFEKVFWRLGVVTKEEWIALDTVDLMIYIKNKYDRE